MAERKQPASMVMTRIGGKDYPLKSLPNCKTCQSPYRIQIENALLHGRTYRGIVRMLADLEPGDLGHPSAEGISDHYKQDHMPINQAVQRRLIERRAEMIGANFESEVDNLVDKITVAEMVVHKGFERLASGEMDPNVQETLAAIKLINDIEKQADGSLDQEAWVGSVQIMMEVAHELMNDDQWAVFGRKLASHPVLNALARRQQKAIEGEIVEH